MCRHPRIPSTHWPASCHQLTLLHPHNLCTPGQRSQRYSCLLVCECLSGPTLHGSAVSNRVSHVSQHGIIAEKGPRCGEREDTLPPGYRFEGMVSLHIFWSLLARAFVSVLPDEPVSSQIVNVQKSFGTHSHNTDLTLSSILFFLNS